MFQSFKLLPSILLTLIKPFGHVFKVTPKGSEARGHRYDKEVFWTAASLIALMVRAGDRFGLVGDDGSLAQHLVCPGGRGHGRRTSRR